MGRGHSRFQKKRNFTISFGGNSAHPMAEKVKFHVCFDGNQAPDFSKN